jgi:hypothetical protein
MNIPTTFQASDIKVASAQIPVIETLTTLRKEWELIADGKGLLHLEGSVGLILFDIVTRLNVPIDEQRYLLGSGLFEEIAEFVTKQG